MLFVAAQFSCDGSGIISVHRIPKTMDLGFEKDFCFVGIFAILLYRPFEVEQTKAGTKEQSSISLTVAKILKIIFPLICDYATRFTSFRVYHQESSLIKVLHRCRLVNR